MVNTNSAEIAVSMAKHHLKKIHSGAIHSTVAGRTDHLPMHVKSGSYVIPADVISGMGEGNTMAGYKVAKDIFSRANRGYVRKEAPYGASGLPYGVSTPGRAEGGKTISNDDALHAAAGAGRAGAGRAGLERVQAGSETGVPIVAAGGEFVIPPEDVQEIGKGSLDDGHKILDHFVKKFRAKTIKTMQQLPGPKKD